MSDEEQFDPPARLTPDEVVASHVAHFREGAKLSQSEVAERMTNAGFRWGQSTVYKVENGVRKLTLLEGVELARILGVDASDFTAHRNVVILLQRQFQNLRAAEYELFKVTTSIAEAQMFVEDHSDQLHPSEAKSLKYELESLRGGLKHAAGQG